MKRVKVLWALGILIILFNVIFYWFRFGDDVLLRYVSDLLPVLCSIIALIFLFMAFNSFKTLDFIKISWFLLFIGIFLFFLGESAYAILEIGYQYDMNEAFPSIADIFWCAGYIPLLISLLIMFIGYVKSGLPVGKVRNYILITLIFIIICAAIIVYLLVPIINDPDSDILEKFFSLYYPVGDLFIVAPAFVIMYITGIIGKGKLSKPWKYIALGFIFITIADLLYSYLSWIGKYGNGNFIDVAWNAGYLLIALSSVYQCELIQSVNEV